MGRDIVLFIGAGFSHGIGLPTMSCFGHASIDHIRRMDRPGHRNRKAVRLLLQAGDIFRSFQSYCKHAQDTVSVDVNNMEEVFCIAESLSQSGVNEVQLNGKMVSVNELENNIKLWLWKMYHEFPPLNSERTDVSNDAKAAYDAFFRFLKDKDLSAKTAIITTNYDLTVEYYSWKKGLKCIYPIQNNKVSEICAVDRSKYERYAQWKMPNSDDIPLCKIHGSINIFTAEDNKYYISLDIANPQEKFGNSVVPNSCRPAIFMQDAVWYMNQKYDKHFVPAVIPPTYSKIHAIPWLQDMWKYALEFLKNAKLLIFIGYSIPESDGFIYSFIRGAMAQRQIQDSLDILIVDPEKSVFNSYTSFFRNINKKDNFFEGTFLQAWQSGLLKSRLIDRS